jgi:hypothetical protein
MVNCFSVALTGLAQSWLMNLPHEYIHSWAKLCHQFLANFESSYKCPDMEADLHVVQ